MNPQEFKLILKKENALTADERSFRLHQRKKTIEKYRSLIEELTPQAKHFDILTRLLILVRHDGKIPTCKICNESQFNEKWIKWDCPTCSKECASKLKVLGWKETHNKIDEATGKTLAQKYAQQKANSRKTVINPTTGLTRQQEIANKTKETKRKTIDENGNDLYRAGAIKTAITRFGKYLGTENKTEFEWYKVQVTLITAKQPLHLLENIKRRAAYGKSDDPYQLDHRFSIIDGFIENIPPYIIGHIVNLQMLPARENSSKGSRSSISKEELIDAFLQHSQLTDGCRGLGIKTYQI